MATASARPSRNFLYCVFELHPAPTMWTVDLIVIILVPAVIVCCMQLAQQRTE